MRFLALVGLTALTLLNIGACGGSLGDVSGTDDDSGSGSESDARAGGDGPFLVDGGVVIDASIEDAGRHRRDGGGFDDAGGFFDGGTHFDGGTFDGGTSRDGGGSLDAGSRVDAQAPDGDGGPQGPRDAGSFTGPLLRDGNGVVLGELISIAPEGGTYTIVTSTDYLVVLNFDGTYANQEFYYDQPACAGTVFLQAGCSGSLSLLGNTVVFCAQSNSLMIPAGPLINGAETSQPVALKTASGNDPPSCLDQGAVTCQGWPLTPTTAANVGLPDTIVPPLSYP